MLTEALRRADEAMYRAKRSSRNAVFTWTQLRELLATKPQSVFTPREVPGGRRDLGCAAACGKPGKPDYGAVSTGYPAATHAL